MGKRKPKVPFAPIIRPNPVLNGKMQPELLPVASVLGDVEVLRRTKDGLIVSGTPESFQRLSKNKNLQVSRVYNETPQFHRLMKFGVFYHEALDVKLDGIGEILDDSKELIESVIRRSYMRSMPTFHVSDDLIDHASPKKSAINRDSFVICCKRFTRRINELHRPDSNYYARAESPRFSMVVNITTGINMVFTTIIYDKKLFIARCNVFCVDTKTRAIGGMSLGSYFIGRKTRVINEVMQELFLRDQTNDRYGTHEDTYLAITLTEFFIRRWEDIAENANYMCNSHSYIEMYAIKEVMRNSKRSAGSAIGSTMLTWHRVASPISKYDELSDSPPPDILINPDVNAPLLDLSEKEMEFIWNYIDKHNYFVPDGTGTPVDLIQVLSHPRYGPTFLWDYVYGEDDEKHTDMTVSYSIFPEDDYIRFYIVHRVNDTITVHVLVDIMDIQHFDGQRNIIAMTVDVVQRDIDKLIDDAPTVMSMVPECMKSIRETGMCILKLLAIHILIHERPQRTRMISYKEKVKQNPRQGKSDGEDSDIVIRRILKPAAEAKELVRESEKTGGSAGERVYTMEEWERVGHYRTTKTGKVVWISGTTCKRKKKLLNGKEIHIKL